MGRLNRNEYMQLLNLVRAGSYKKCCQVVEENHQIPIEGIHSLNYLVACCQSYQKQFSTKCLVKFINCLDLTEDTRSIDFKNYILSVLNIVKFLLDKNDWNGIKLIWHLIHPFHHDLKEDMLKYYYSIREILLQGFAVENANVSDKLLQLILEFTTELEKAYPKDGVLLMLYKFILRFRPKFGMKLISWSIDIVIKNECNIFAKANFKYLVALLKAFSSDATSLDFIDELNAAIERICAHIKTRAKKEALQADKGFVDVIDYLESTIELYKPLDQIDLTSPKVFLRPIQKINGAHSNSASLVYLSDVVRLCTVVQGQIAQIERSRTKPPIWSKVNYTPVLENSLHAYVSHAKSQAIILKRTVRSTKCCCSTATYYVAAIKTHTDAFDYVARILHHCVKNPADVSADLYAALRKLLASTVEMLQVVADADCTHFAYAWDIICARVYSCVQKLVQDKRQNVAILFVEPVVQTRFRFGEKIRKIDEKYADSMLCLLADCLVALKRYDDALDACAVGARFSHTNADKCLRIWNSVTYNSKNEETVCERLAKKSPYMRTLCGDIQDLTESQKVDVCRREVRNYVAYYKKWQLVERCLSQLANLLDCKEFLSFLLTLRFEALHACYFDIPWKENFSEAGLDALHCAIYKYCAYKDNLRTQRKNFKELPKVLPIEGRLAGDTPHAKNYSHLSLKVYEKITTPLREAFGALSRCKEFNDSHELAIDIAIQMGHEFELHCDKVNAHKTWQFAYENSITTKNCKQQICAATFLLKYLPIGTIKTVQDSIVKLFLSYDKDVYARFKFYAQLTVIYLRNYLLDDFRRCYQKTVHLFYKFGGTRYADNNTEKDVDKDLATGYYALVIGALDMLECKDVVDELHGHQLFPLNHIWERLRYYMYYPHGTEKRTELYNVFFDLGEHIVWKYYWRTMHRQAQTCARTVASAAEIALCTFRVYKQVLYLGKTALLCNESDKAQSFLSDLEVILQIDYADPEEELSAKLDNLVLIRAASPVAIKKHRAPEFLQHARDCSCTCCTIRECQVALMEVYLLKTNVAALYGDPKTTNNLLKGCFKLYRMLQERFEFFSGDTYAELLRTRMRVGSGNDPESLKRDKDEICALFRQRKIWNAYLFNDVNILYVTSCLKLAKASKNRHTRDRTPESRGINLDDQHSPVIQTPVLAKGSYLPETRHKQSESRNRLEVTEPSGGARPKLRGKNLYAELNDEKNSEKTPAVKKETKEETKRLTRAANTRKQLR